MVMRITYFLPLSLLIPTSFFGAVAVEGAVSLRRHGSFAGRGAASNVATSMRGDAQSDFGVDSNEDPPPACSCDCCDVSMRLPGEFKFDARVKCTPSSEHSADLCGDQCSLSKEDIILKDEIVDFQRFCFFECKPAAGARAPTKSGCVALADNEVERVVDPAGNPIDPAFLYAPANRPPPAGFVPGSPPEYTALGASANLLSMRSRLAQPQGTPKKGSPDAVDKKAAKKDALKGITAARSEGADARKVAAKLRKEENAKQEKLNTALKESGNGEVALDPLASIEDLNAATIAGKTAAEQANLFASQAVGAYDVGRQKIWKLSLQEASKEVLRWKKHAEDEAAKLLKAMFAPTWQSEAAKKAQKASEPYIEGMLRATDSVRIYTDRGFELSKKSKEQWAQAMRDADAANKLPRRTMRENNMAKMAIYDAREKAKEAQNMAMQARQYFATASETRKSIPMYQHSAQTAAAAAVARIGGPR